MILTKLIYSGRKIQASSSTKAPEIEWNPPNKSKNFPVGILLPFQSICGAFLQDPVAVIFDLSTRSSLRLQMILYT
jgi:hypothetical protein